MRTISRYFLLCLIFGAQASQATSYICKSSGSSMTDGVYLLNISQTETKLCHYKEQDNTKLKLIESSFGTTSNRYGNKADDIIFYNAQSNIIINTRDINGDRFKLNFSYDFGIGLGPKAHSKYTNMNSAICHIDMTNTNCPAVRYLDPKNMPLNSELFIRRMQDAVDWEGENNPIFSLVSSDRKSFTIITYKQGHFWVGEYFQDGGSGPFANIKLEASKKLKDEYLSKGWTLIGEPYFTKTGLELFNKLSR